MRFPDDSDLVLAKQRRPHCHVILDTALQRRPSHAETTHRQMRQTGVGRQTLTHRHTAAVHQLHDVRIDHDTAQTSAACQVVGAYTSIVSVLSSTRLSISAGTNSTNWPSSEVSLTAETPKRRDTATRAARSGHPAMIAARARITCVI